MSDQVYYTVYQITNLINGMIYIGKHHGTDPYNDHYLGGGTIIKRAIKKYGRENFKKEILYVLESSKAAYEKEKEIVDKDFVARKDTYNLKEGGYGGWDHIDAAKLWQDEEYREKQVNASKRLWNDPDYQEKQAKLREEPEYKRKISEGLKRSWDNPEHRKKMSETQKKSQNRPEVIEKQRKAHQGTYWAYCPETDTQARIKKGDPIPDGYIKGCRPKNA